MELLIVRVLPWNRLYYHLFLSGEEKKREENVMSAGGDCSFTCEPLLSPCATDSTAMFVIDQKKRKEKKHQAVLGDGCPHFFLKLWAAECRNTGMRNTEVFMQSHNRGPHSCAR